MGRRSSTTGQIVTVFGATGFVGRYLVNRLGRIGTQVVIPFRGEEYDIMHLRQMGDLVSKRFNLQDEQTMTEAIRHSHVVVNLIAQDRNSFNYKPAMVNVAGAERIAKICKQMENPPRLIHVSCLGAKEHTKSEYWRTKWEGEQIIRQEFPDAVILRPACLFGHEDRLLNFLGTFSYLPFGIPVINGGNQTRYPLYVGDLAEAILRSCQAKNGLVEGHTFDLYGNEQYTMRSLTEAFIHNTMKNCRIISMPSWMVWLYSKLYIDIRYALCTRDTVKQVSEDEQIDPNNKTLSDLGIDNPKSLHQTMIEYVRIFRHPESYGVDVPLPELPLQVVQKSVKITPRIEK